MKETKHLLISWHAARFALLLVAVALVLSACATSGPDSGKAWEPKHYSKSKAKFHKVRPGDSLYSLSFKAGVDFKKLAAWNRIRKPYTIYPGQIVRLVPPYTKKVAVKPKVRPSNKKAIKPATKPAYIKPKPSKKTTPSKVASNLKWKWPAKGKVVAYYSSKDASRDGIKIAGRENQKILAAERGDIVYVGSGLVGYGRLIIIKHNNSYLSAYGLNNKLLVKEGDKVVKGQHIANMGLTNSGKPMLHFEIRRSGKPVNPLSYLPKK